MRAVPGYSAIDTIAVQALMAAGFSAPKKTQVGPGPVPQGHRGRFKRNARRQKGRKVL